MCCSWLVAQFAVCKYRKVFRTYLRRPYDVDDYEDVDVAWTECDELLTRFVGTRSNAPIWRPLVPLMKQVIDKLIDEDREDADLLFTAYHSDLFAHVLRSDAACIWHGLLNNVQNRAHVERVIDRCVEHGVSIPPDILNQYCQSQRMCHMFFGRRELIQQWQREKRA